MPGALITSVEKAFQQYKMILQNNSVYVGEGKDLIQLGVDSLCIHGDNPNVIDILKAIV